MLKYLDSKDTIFAILSGQKEDPVFIDCGKISYAEALNLQSSLQKKRTEGTIQNVYLLLEHPPVITMGARKADNKLLTSPDEMNKLGIHLEQIRRGGGATSHNPGQLVLYPIINLRSLGFRVVPYVHYLEQIGIELLASYGITCSRKKGFPGLWVDDGRKIASIGVQINVGVTMHGIAINLNNDLSIFSHIIPCGLEGVEMTSVEKETRGKAAIDIDAAKNLVVDFCVKNLPANNPRFSKNGSKQKSFAGDN
ncbi:MAG: lipoyl(octanoyl) transferase LipB [Spirochaetales bacterium]|nr:lipoyl(octanoyl) transferase LipB [Spirochaetales bacterium]